MTCNEAREKLVAYFDGELPPGEAAEFKAHLAQCEACSAEIQAEIAGELGFPMGRLRTEMDDGRAFAALFADAELQKQHLIQGSPTFLLNEGRQKLYGNVGYRIIRANLEELLEGPEGLASWC